MLQVASLQRAMLKPGINAHRYWSSFLTLLPPHKPADAQTERIMLYTEWIDHSLLLSGDADRPCSMFGRDFVVGGEDVVDGGDVVESAPSRAASALKAFVLDSSFFSFSFTGGVPVRLLLPLSSR